MLEKNSFTSEQKRKTSIKRRFLVYSVILFLIITVGGSIMFFINMRNIVRADMVQELSRLIENKASYLESSTAKEVAIAMKMADSPIIKEYFLHPDNTELERLAFNEIAGYRRAFTGNNVFWLNDIDHNYYFGDEYSYTLDPADPSSAWYVSIIRNPSSPYFFNVNTDIGIKKTMMWINAPVMEQGRAIGVVGTGIDLTGFIDDLYADAAADKPFYLFNSANVITGASSWDLVASEKTLADHFGSLGETIGSAAKELAAKGELNTFTAGNTEYVVSYIPSLDWYIVTMMSLNSRMIYNSGMTILFYMIIVVILFIFIIINILIFRMVQPLDKTVVLLAEIADTWDLTRRFKVTSTDEIGRLSEILNYTFGKMCELLKSIKKESVILSEIGSDLAANMNETAAAVNQITANIQSIKGRVINQSASVTETHATMEQLVLNIKRLNGHIDKQSSNVSRASSAIEEMVANIHSVTETLVNNGANVTTLKEAAEVGRSGLQDVATDIQEIARESEGLLEINSVMENIASQTNLLSMNAAIEAAHAGEAGKGFAVVADEIRKLAESSSEQSKTIGTVLKKIKGSIDKITMSTNNVLQKFEAIDLSVKTVAQQEDHIRASMEEQGTGSKVILEGVAEVNEITRQVNDDSHEMHEGAQEVISESQNLEKATQEITAVMNEMATGADHINTAVSHVSDISVKNRDAINVLINEVSRFKVE